MIGNNKIEKMLFLTRKKKMRMIEKKAMANQITIYFSR